MFSDAAGEAVKEIERAAVAEVIPGACRLGSKAQCLQPQYHGGTEIDGEGDADHIGRWWVTKQLTQRLGGHGKQVQITYIVSADTDQQKKKQFPQVVAGQMMPIVT